ncbi:patatin-like phospholipase family protein [bacterium]|nr:patatin-like phospholipase family protein [bacterium]
MSFKVGLALGGGAARGLAHLGVIKALQQAKIPIDIICGTSVGAVIGSIYAANPDIDWAIAKVKTYLSSSDFDKTRLDLIKKGSLEPDSYFGQLKRYIKTGLIFAISLHRSSFISEEVFRANLEQILPKGNIEDCPIKLGLVSMNLDTAEEEVSLSGNIIQNVMASSAIPGVFPPVNLKKSKFVDGSWVNPVPVSVAKAMGAKFIIAVDVAPGMDKNEKDLNGFDVTLKAAEGSRMALKKYWFQNSDIALGVDLMDMHWADFSQIEMCIERGEKIINGSLSEIKKKLFLKRMRSKLFL